MWMTLLMMARQSIEQEKTGWVRTTIGIVVPVGMAAVTDTQKLDAELKLAGMAIAVLVGLAAFVSHLLTIMWKYRNMRPGRRQEKEPWPQDRDPDDYR